MQRTRQEKGYRRGTEGLQKRFKQGDFETVYSVLLACFLPTARAVKACANYLRASQPKVAQASAVLCYLGLRSTQEARKKHAIASCAYHQLVRVTTQLRPVRCIRMHHARI